MGEEDPIADHPDEHAVLVALELEQGCAEVDVPDHVLTLGVNKCPPTALVGVVGRRWLGSVLGEVERIPENERLQTVCLKPCLELGDRRGDAFGVRRGNLDRDNLSH